MNINAVLILSIFVVIGYFGVGLNGKERFLKQLPYIIIWFIGSSLSLVFLYLTLKEVQELKNYLQ